MNKNLEETFRSALENHEVPFDPKAWSKMNHLLDQRMPVSKFNWLSKLAILTGTAALVTGVGYWIWDARTSDVQTDDTATEQLTSQSGAEDVSARKKDTPNISKPLNQEVINDSKKVENTPLSSKEKEQPTNVSAANSGTTVANKPSEVVSSNSNITEPKAANREPNQSTVLLPKIQNQCQNETIRIDNSNDVAIILTYPSGKTKKIATKEFAKIKLTEDGVYTLGAEGTHSSFHVSSAPQPLMSISGENEYENGVPTLHLNASGKGKHEWKVSGLAQPFEGNQATVHLFKKGKYDVVYTNEVGGCSAQITQTVIIEEDYNLLAPNAFRPYDYQEKNQTFMPYALTERNTGFQLIITDPRYGKVVYQTSDARRGWDGIDRNTGEMVPENTEFVWKVTLVKPLPNEAKNYSGRVMWVR